MAKGTNFQELNDCILKTVESIERQTGRKTLYDVIPDYIFLELNGNPGIYWPASAIHGLYLEPTGFVIVPEDDKRFDL